MRQQYKLAFYEVHYFRPFCYIVFLPCNISGTPVQYIWYTRYKNVKFPWKFCVGA